jgi:hypothetical protein
MKRSIILALVATLVAGLSAVGAHAAPGPQKVDGSVLMPGPGPNGETTGGCWTGWARRFWIFSQGATAGPMGYMFEVDKATWGGKFKLEVTAGMTGTEDLDMTFYANPGEIDPNDPAMQNGIQESGAYLSREPGGEEGIVPQTATLALVCLGTGTGADAEFTYTATPLKKKKKK